MSERTSWELDDLLDKEAGKLYECLFCLGLPKNPKMCNTCEHTFCTECLVGYTNTDICPYRCPKPTYTKVPNLVMRAINELKTKCPSCEKTFTLEEIDKHSKSCMKPKCAAPGCDVTEEEMKEPIKYNNRKFCSLACKYTYLTTEALKVSGRHCEGECHDVDPARLSAEVKKIMLQFQGENKIVEEVLQHVAPQATLKGSLSVSKPIEPSGAGGSTDGVVNFHWDPEACASQISLSENNMFCFLMETGYCFRSVVGSTAFMGGIAYWEIVGDDRTENELKLGVVSRKNFNFSTAFCDYDYGWGYYGLGQLRHGNNCSGSNYGKKFKNVGVLGVYLNMNKGILSFALDGQPMGLAFNDPNLKKGPLFASVSLLHKAGCKLIVGKPAPAYFNY